MAKIRMKELKVVVKTTKHEDDTEYGIEYFDACCSWLSNDSGNLCIFEGSKDEFEGSKDESIIATFASGEWRFVERRMISYWKDDNERA